MTQRNHSTYRSFYLKSLLALFVLGLVAYALYWYKTSKAEQQKSSITHPTVTQTTKTNQHKPPDVVFTEESEIRGVKYNHFSGATGNKWLPESMGAGIAIIDIENDGDLDLFLTNGTSWDGNNNTSNQLFVNDGQGYFTEQSANRNINQTLYGTGVAVADVNQDGFQDIFVAAIGSNVLYLNQQDGTYKISDNSFNCEASDWTTSAGFFDYDNDGDSDLLTLNYIQWSQELDNHVNYQIEGIGKAYGPPTNFPGTQVCLFENKDGEFYDVSVASGFNNNEVNGKSKALGLLFWDLNQDNWMDVIVANDTVANQVYINNTNATFSEKGGLLGLGFDASGKSTGAMGIDAAHHHNDEQIAIVMGNFGSEATSYYVSKSDSFFTDDSMVSGIGSPSRAVVTFGVFFFDYDLDGRQDYFQTNGHVENLIQQVESSVTYKQHNQLFWNCGNSCAPYFQLVTGAGDLLSEPLVGRSAAYADFDKDGDLDIVVSQVDGPVKVYMNQQKTNNNWLTLNLTAKDNRSLIGSKVKVNSDQGKQQFVYSQTKSYQTQVQPWITIGLGENTEQRVSVTITELNGKEHVREFTSLNQFVDWEL